MDPGPCGAFCIAWGSVQFVLCLDHVPVYLVLVAIVRGAGTAWNRGFSLPNFHRWDRMLRRTC